MPPNAAMPPEQPPATGFLPDFRRIEALFPLLLLTELAALVLSLSAEPADFWTDLGGRSLFMQWIALGSAVLLTPLHRPLARLPDRWSGPLAFLLVQAVALLTNWLVYLGLPAMGWFVALLPAEQIPAALARNMAVSGIIAAVLLRHMTIHARWRSQVKAEAEARLDALQARMRPHFLFNSLNTIASLLRSRPDQAEELVLDLADLFRTSLRRDRRWTTLAEETALARRYVNIEQQRLGERLRVEWRLDDLPDDALLPPLSLQPLVENAVYHGIEPLPQGGCLEIAGTRGGPRGALLCITVSNPMGPAKQQRDGSHQALDNLQARWSACFPQLGSLELEPGDGRFRATLVFPYVKHADDT